MNYNRVRRWNRDNSTRIHAPAPKVQGRNAEAVGRRANSEHSACNVTPHSAPSPDGMGVRLSHFGPPKLNYFKGLLNLSTSSPAPTPDHQPGEETEAATIKLNRATWPHHPVPTRRRKLYIGPLLGRSLMGTSGNASMLCSSCGNAFVSHKLRDTGVALFEVSCHLRSEKKISLT